MIEKLILTCDRLLSQQQVACCHSYCGLPARGKDMLIYSTADKESKVCHHSFLIILLFLHAFQCLEYFSKNVTLSPEFAHCARCNIRKKIGNSHLMSYSCNTENYYVLACIIYYSVELKSFSAVFI